MKRRAFLQPLPVGLLPPLDDSLRRLGFPLLVACLVAVAFVTVLGVLVHFLIIAPMLDASPINQLLATGGLLFFLQSFATLLFTTDFLNIGVRLPSLEVGEMFISTARLLASIVALRLPAYTCS